MEWNVLLLALMLASVGVSSCSLVGSRSEAGQLSVGFGEEGQEMPIPCGKSMPVPGAIKPRIVFGQEANPGQFPFQASLVWSKGDFFCGGVIYDDHHILTAAHCLLDGNTQKWRKPSEFLVAVGDWDITKPGDGARLLEVERLAGHEDYNRDFFYKDIGIIRVKTKLNWTLTQDGFGSVNRICLPEREMEYETGLSVMVSGWGRDERGRYPPILRYTNTTIMHGEVCELQRADRICLDGTRGQRYGDSGGPVFRELAGGRAELVGIVSAIVRREPHHGIATDVSKYLAWIQEKIAQFEG